MSKFNIERMLARKTENEPKSQMVLCVIPDTTALTRDVFKSYLIKFPKANKFGFSKKHTEEITSMRKKQGVDHYPDKIYSLPVLWDQQQTYIA